VAPRHVVRDHQQCDTGVPGHGRGGGQVGVAGLDGDRAVSGLSRPPDRLEAGLVVGGHADHEQQPVGLAEHRLAGSVDDLLPHQHILAAGCAQHLKGERPQRLMQPAQGHALVILGCGIDVRGSRRHPVIVGIERCVPAPRRLVSVR
jgi:hypothetical protein